MFKVSSRVSYMWDWCLVGTVLELREEAPVWSSRVVPRAVVNWDSLSNDDDLEGRRVVNVEDLIEPREFSPIEQLVQTSQGLVVSESFLNFPSWSGGTRRTYVGEKWVYKRPRNKYGVEQNELEADLYQFGSSDSRRGSYLPKDIPVAECYLLDDGTLMMERVKKIYDLHGNADLTWGDLPRELQRAEWVDRVDSGQVGVNRDGKLVAFDV